MDDRLRITAGITTGNQESLISDPSEMIGQQSSRPYESPRVILELELETQMGSPCNPIDPFDIINCR